MIDHPSDCEVFLLFFLFDLSLVEGLGQVFSFGSDRLVLFSLDFGNIYILLLLVFLPLFLQHKIFDDLRCQVVLLLRPLYPVNRFVAFPKDTPQLGIQIVYFVQLR